MPNIYDLFRSAASLVEKTPYQYRVLAGAGAGAFMQAAHGDRDVPFTERIEKGLVYGAGIGLTAGSLVRGAGLVAQAGERIGRGAITRKVMAVKNKGIKQLFRPGMLTIAGAAAGAYMAPPGNKTAGAMIGGGLGLATIPAMKLYKGYEALGKIPGGQTSLLLAAAAVPVAAGIIGSRGIPPESQGVAYPGPGGIIDYKPLSTGMQDRMTAMNASGDIVLGLHNRQNG